MPFPVAFCTERRMSELSKESASRDSELDLEAIIAEFSECEDSDHGASSAPAVAAPHPESPRKDNGAEPEHR